MLKDKVCIVTGAASGIGLSIAQSFAKEGANVIMSDINQASLSQESDKIKADYFASDLSTQKGCIDLVDYVLKEHHLLITRLMTRLKHMAYQEKRL